MALFSKRTHGILNILFILGSYESLARLESKIRKCLFFDGSLLEKYSVRYHVLPSRLSVRSGKKSPKQETGLRNRESLKDMDDTE